MIGNVEPKTEPIRAAFQNVLEARTPGEYRRAADRLFKRINGSEETNSEQELDADDASQCVGSGKL
jgi:hypothetical protein